MITKYSQLIWIGAGTATEPKNLIDRSKNVLLVDARRDACNKLENIFRDNTSITIEQAVVTPGGADFIFYEYNLPEYSSLSEPTGLKDIFPGIRIVRKTIGQSISILDLVAKNLTDENSILVLDIIDSTLPNLEALAEKSLLAKFTEVIIAASVEMLYFESKSQHSLVTWLEEHGFLLNDMNEKNSEFSYLHFKRNPLLQKIQSAESELITSRNLISSIEEKLQEANLKLENHELVNILNEKLSIEFEETKAGLKKQNDIHAKELHKLQDESKKVILELELVIEEAKSALKINIDSNEKYLKELIENHEKELNKITDEHKKVTLDFELTIEKLNHENKLLITENEKIALQLEDQIKNSSIEITKLNDKIDNITEKYECDSKSQQDNNNKSAEHITQLKKTIASSELKIENLQKENSAISTEHLQVVTALTKEIDTLRQQVSEQQASIKKHAAIIQQTKAQNLDYEQQLAITKNESELKVHFDTATAVVLTELDQAKQQITSQKTLFEQFLLDTKKLQIQQKEQFDQISIQNNKRIVEKESEVQMLRNQLEAVNSTIEKSKNEFTEKFTNSVCSHKNTELQLEKLKIEHEKNLKLLKEFADLNLNATSQLDVYKQWQISITPLLENLPKKIVGDISKNLLNNVKQIESFVGLTDLLSDGNMPLNYHGWPISADIALYLAKKVITDDFDYIIEFGSGTSTVIFGKALLVKSKLTEKENACKVVSFEHNKLYLQKTISETILHGINSTTDVVYAPLIETTLDDSSYLYYSCEEKLDEISLQLKTKNAKILVLVDGPPADTGPLARYPAIPLILKHLAKHEIHIIMDDYVREDEKKAAAKWSKLFDERGIKNHKELLNFEKSSFMWILNN